jgi:UDP-N-acetylmuramate--alanine ligase
MPVTGLGSRRLHFIAIGGAGMSGLALVCHRLGATVTGSDRAESSYFERVRAAGIDARLGHDADAVPADAEVVVSTAVPDDNPELRRARERGQRVLHRGGLLAELCALKRLIAVAGTHGKTTTAGMLAHALREIGGDPAFVLGGELPERGDDGRAANAGWGEGEWIVAEADESDASFLELRPEVATVTNVELDHHAHWGSTAALVDAFRRFAEPASGLALLADPVLDAIAGDQRTLRFGAVELAADGRPPPAGGWTPPREPQLAVPGRHNHLNAIAALAAIELAGLDVEAAAAALATFPGMLRRLERKGDRNGAAVYDD